MKLFLLSCAFACLAWVPGASAQAATQDAPLMLRLRDGSVQWGAIQSHDVDGLVFQRLDTGGVLHLPWNWLDPVEERDLRTRFGYLDESGEELMIDADRLVTVKGAEFIGKIVDKSGASILLKTASGTLTLPKDQIAQIGDIVQVAAREVYTPDELYAQAAANADLSHAQGQFELAQFCEKAFDFAHATEHYKKASELDASFRKDDVRLALSRVAEKAKAQAELEYLAAIDQLTKRAKFDAALARASAFKEKFPASTLQSEAKKRYDRAIRARTAWVGDQVSRLWMFYAERLARDVSSKSLDEVMAYLDDKMKQDIVAAVLAGVQKASKATTENDVRQAWKSRKKVRYLTASYGLGTWLLGKAAALKGNDDDGKKEGDKKPVAQVDQQRAQLEAKIKRFLETQEIARRAQTAADQKDERQSAWNELSPGARASWVLAWYVENSGDLEVDPKPMIQPCAECAGKGLIETLVTAGTGTQRGNNGNSNRAPSNEATRECPGCHGVAAVRRIRYR